MTYIRVDRDIRGISPIYWRSQFIGHMSRIDSSRVDAAVWFQGNPCIIRGAERNAAIQTLNEFCAHLESQNV